MLFSLSAHTRPQDSQENMNSVSECTCTYLDRGGFYCATKYRMITSVLIIKINYSVIEMSTEANQVLRDCGFFYCRGR